MDLEKEIARIFAPVQPSQVILFGSRARGDADDDSDVDLVVVYRTDKRFLDRLEELYALWNLPLAVDILAYTPEEFAEMRVRSPVVADAVAYGKVILEAA
jgi:predicted nucleotidyltransferase